METTERIARAFSANMLEAIGREKLGFAIAANALNPSAPWCASADWCDANMVMLDTLASVLGVSEDWVMDRIETDSILNLWNVAWTVARANHFYQ